MRDSRQFDAFYGDARQRVLRCVYLLTGDAGEAQDVTQEAFVRAWQRWEHVGGYAEPEAWVRLVACRLATTRWRSLMRGRNAVRLLKASMPAVTEAPSPQRLDVVSALRRLPAPQRIAIVLHYYAGLSIAEIAQETQVAEGTVKARLSRARGALAQILGSEHELEVGHG